jgi:hypothetical protein
LRRGLVIVVCALAVNGPQYARNLQLFGSPLGPGGEGPYRYANQDLSLRILASNVLRNLGLHLGTPWPAANSAIERAIVAAHAAIGIAPDDPRSTWPTTRFEIIRPVAREDLAPSGLHLLLIAAAIVTVWRTRPDARLKAYTGCLIVAFLLFCFLLRWQPWDSRLHLPLFVLGAPVAGVVLERLKPTVLAVVLLMLGAASVYFLAMNPAHPLVGRRAVFKTAWADQRVAHADPAYVGATRFVTSTGCLRVGLALGSNDREYIFWALLADARWSGTLEPVMVGNVSARMADPAATPFRPCAIIRLADSPVETLKVGEQSYRSAWSQDAVQVFVRDLPASLGSRRAGARLTAGRTLRGSAG